MTTVLPSCPFPLIPWICYASISEAQINVSEHYIKQTWRNRYAIASSHGNEILTIPVSGQKGEKRIISDIAIFGNSWRRQHMQAIRSAYGKSAYYIYVEEELTKLILEGKQTFLIDFNEQSLALCARFLDLKNVDKTESFVQMNNTLWEPAFLWPDFPAYTQVFADRMPFIQGLSVLDLIMNMGKRSVDYILLLKNGGTLPSVKPFT